MDTVGEFLTRVRNGGMAKLDKVDVRSSKMRESIAAILKDNNYIRSFKVVDDGRQGIMRVYLKYKKNGEHVISNVSRVSKPGKRQYRGAENISEVRSGYGKSVLSTSKGLLTGEKAKELGIGGEVLFNIW